MLPADGRTPPELWTAVSAWCPISDISRWHRESRERKRVYADHIESACGGDPETSEKALEEARKRSPVSWLANAKDVLPVDINTGIHDGHTGSVPVGQSIRAYNLLAAPEDRIPEADISFIEENEKIPSHLAAKEGDPAYGTHAILLRKRSRQVRLTIFEGRHDMFFETAFDWLGRQISGHPADFSAGQPIDLSDNAHLGK